MSLLQLCIGAIIVSFTEKLINPESLLLDYIFEGYNKDAKPFMTNGEAVQVLINLSLGRIAKLVSPMC